MRPVHDAFTHVLPVLSHEQLPQHFPMPHVRNRGHEAGPRGHLLSDGREELLGVGHVLNHVVAHHQVEMTDGKLRRHPVKRADQYAVHPGCGHLGRGRIHLNSPFFARCGQQRGEHAFSAPHLQHARVLLWQERHHLVPHVGVVPGAGPPIGVVDGLDTQLLNLIPRRFASRRP